MIIEVFTKDKFDVESKNITKNFTTYGGSGAIKLTKLYDINARERKDYFNNIARFILIDPVVEDFNIESLLRRGRIIIELWLKESIVDLLGESVKMAIGDYGFKPPEMVRTGKRFYFEICDIEKARSFIEEEFSNEIIHRIKIEKGNLNDKRI